MLFRSLQALAATVVVLGIATLRVIASGEREIAASTAALYRADAREATVRARRAAGWYAPGAPHVRVAYERLRALAGAAEEHREIEMALFAWRAIRTASTETHWLLAPHLADRELANREIDRLSRSPDASNKSAMLPSRHVELLMRDDRPRLGWVVALVTSFAVLSSGIVLAARQLAGAAGRVHWAQARWSAFLVVMGIALWLAAVWQA